MDLIPASIKQIWFDDCDERFFDEKFDAVIAYMPEMTNILERFVNTKKKILWIHGDYSTDNEVTKAYIMSFMKKVDIVISPSTGASNALINLLPEFKKKIYTVPHTMRDDIIKKLAQEKINDWPNTLMFSIVTIGKLNYNAKGIDRMIRVHRKLLDEELDFQWIVLGDGLDREWIEALIKENELQEKFLLLGFKKNPYPYVNKANLFAILSYHEGYCLALNEAKILGKPIIATNFAGASDQISNNFNGMIVENNEEGILEGLKKILTDNELRNLFTTNFRNYKHPNSAIINSIDEIIFEKNNIELLNSFSYKILFVIL